MNKKKRSFIASMRDALAGIRRTAMRERNFRIQIFCGIAAVIACIIFRVDVWHFVLVGFAIFFVLAMELVNTAVEAVVDMLAGGRQHPLAKVAKDASAGAVLLAAMFSVVVALVVATSIIRRFI
jgi:diacylglycerol kinase